MGEIIVNCDLGENESASQTERLMALIGAANICCGVHAGSESKTRETLELAKRNGVMVGAHPGLSDGGGRGATLPSATEFDLLLQEQISRFLRIAAEVDVPVRYVKLHGTLYHAVEQDDALAAVYLRSLKAWNVKLGVFCLAGSRFSSVARGEGIQVWDELFADRGYTSNGRLVPRDQPGALLDSTRSAIERYTSWQQTGAMPTVEGGSVALPAETICVHSDSPDSVELLELLRCHSGSPVDES
jgi:UPF0271 protein